MRVNHRPSTAITANPPTPPHPTRLSYGVPADMPQRLANARVPTTLTWGQLDWIHTAQIERWRGGRSREEVPAKIYRFHGHASLCAVIDHLQLWEKPEMWSDGGLTSKL